MKMKTRKRSQRENSQTSSNFPDSKRRNCKILPIQNKKNISQKKEMNDKEWQIYDDALLTQLGNMRRYNYEDAEFKPRCLKTNSNIRSRPSTSRRSGSSQSVDQAPTYHVASVESPFSEVLAHLHSQHRERFSPNRVTLFSRYLDHNATAAGVFLRLPGHEQQLYFIENVDLDAYKDPWPRN